MMTILIKLLSSWWWRLWWCWWWCWWWCRQAATIAAELLRGGTSPTAEALVVPQVNFFHCHYHDGDHYHDGEAWASFFPSEHAPAPATRARRLTKRAACLLVPGLKTKLVPGFKRIIYFEGVGILSELHWLPQKGGVPLPSVPVNQPTAGSTLSPSPSPSPPPSPSPSPLPLSSSCPQVSHGAGATLEGSHNNAAHTALKTLASNGLDTVVENG